MKSKKKLLICAAVLLLLGLGLTSTWLICDWPPPRLILKYGLPPAGGATGRSVSLGGMEFVEIDAGYCKIGSSWPNQPNAHRAAWCRLLVWLGLHDEPTREPAPRDSEPRWVEIDKVFWIQRRVIDPNVVQMSVLAQGEGVLKECGALREFHPLAFCDWMSIRLGLDFRMPSAEEWEYAIRSGMWSSVMDLPQCNDSVLPVNWQGVAWNARWMSPAVLSLDAPWIEVEFGDIELNGEDPFTTSAKTQVNYRIRLIWSPP